MTFAVLLGILALVISECEQCKGRDSGFTYQLLYEMRIKLFPYELPAPGCEGDKFYNCLLSGTASVREYEIDVATKYALFSSVVIFAFGLLSYLELLRVIGFSGRDQTPEVTRADKET